jgi:hypothetical protein
MNGEGLSNDHIVLTSYETLFNGFGWQLWRFLIGRCLPFLACIFLIGFVGCAVIPTPEHALLEGRGKVDESDIAFLSVSKTTREDVLLRFGEPDLVLYDQRILVYHWSVCHGYWLVAGGYSAAGGPIPKNYLFMLEFDDEGRLKRFERGGSIWTSEKSQIDKWIPPGSKKLSGLNIYIDPIPVTYVQTVTLNTEFRPARFQVGEFCDNRASHHFGTFIGQMEGRFSFVGIEADVQTCRPINGMLQAAVTNQLQAMGHKLVSKDADVIITGKVSEFEVTTSSNYPDYVILGTLDVILKVQSSVGMKPSNNRRYKAKVKHVLKMFVEFNRPEIEAKTEQVMRDCLEDMQRQIASDTELIRLLRGKTH